MRLGAPLRGVVYGFALIVAAPLWQAGEQKAALFIGAVAIFAVALEAMSAARRLGR